MCVSNNLRGDIRDSIFRPHRLVGAPSLIDPVLHPNDKRNKPKQPAVTPAVQRQAYKNPVSRESLASSDPNARRRLAGVATSAQGVTDAASTTRRVKTGGDQQLSPSIGGGGGASVSGGAASGATPPPSSSGGFVIPIIANPALQAAARKRGVGGAGGGSPFVDFAA